MSYSNGIISEPIPIPADINAALGTSHTDLGAMCKDSNINKWAMYKPEGKVSGSGISGNMPLGYLLLNQRKLNYFGLTPKLNDKAKAVAFGYGGTDAKNVGASGYTVSDILTANEEWPYTKPAGGIASPYRLTDFGCDRDKTYGIQGYRHNARSPIFGWINWEIFRADIQSIINASIVGNIYNTGDNAADWKVDNILYDGTYYNTISGRLSENSASRFGGAGDDMIPISWLLGGISTEFWRIGLGVFIDSETKMHVFTSSYALKHLANATTIMQQGPVFPALGTNQFLCKKMISALGSSSYKTFTAIPLLVKNCIQTTGQLDGSTQTLVTFSGANTLIYSVPSDSVAMTITLRNESKPSVAGVTTIDNSATTDGKFVLGTYGTGQYAGTGGSSSSITPILGLAIFLADGVSMIGTASIRFNVTYTYGINGQSRSTQTISGTVNISSSNTITVNGNTYVGVSIAVAPALAVSSYDRLVYTS